MKSKYFEALRKASVILPHVTYAPTVVGPLNYTASGVKREFTQLYLANRNELLPSDACERGQSHGSQILSQNVSTRQVLVYLQFCRIATVCQQSKLKLDHRRLDFKIANGNCSCSWY